MWSKRTLVSLVIFILVYILFFEKPLGLDPRPIYTRGNTIYNIFTFESSFLFAILSIPLLWKRPRAGSATGILTAVLLIAGVPLDYLGLVIPGQPAPFVILSVEIVESVVSLILIFLCLRTYSAVSSEKSRPN